MPLDEVTIHGAVNVGCVEGEEKDVMGSGFLGGALGVWDGDDVTELVRVKEVVDLGEDGGIGVEDHAAVDIVDDLIIDNVLKVVFGEDGAGEGSSSGREGCVGFMGSRYAG